MSCSSAPVTATSRSMPRERRADRADRLGDAEAVLEQPVAVGLVVVLGRRRRCGSRPTARSPRRTRAPAGSAGAAPGSWRAARAARSSICSTARAGPSSRSSSVEAPGSAASQAAQVDLRAEARMHGVAAADPHRRAGARELLDLGQLLPHHARDRARAVAELQAQVVAAVAPLAALGLADEQDLVDLRCRRSARSGAWLEGRHGCGRDPAAPARPAAGYYPRRRA